MVLLGKIRIIKWGSGLVRIIELSPPPLVTKSISSYRAYQNTQHFFDLPKLRAKEFELSSVDCIIFQITKTEDSRVWGKNEDFI